MNPDPVYDKLARFSPDPGGLDPAEVLFRAGRASARTPRGWKVAVAGLLLSNAVGFGWLALRPVPESAQTPVPLVLPAQVAEPPPAPPVEASPWSAHTLMGTLDTDRLPPPEAVAGLTDPGRPLALISARRGEID